MSVESMQSVVDLGAAREARKRASFQISPEEMDALFGLSDLAWKVYFVLRSRMDFASGVVGRPYLISLGMLVEQCEQWENKGRGARRLPRTLRQVRTALDRLVEAGLLRRLDTEHLVFRMLLARTEQVRSFQTRHDGVTLRGSPEANAGAGLRDERAQQDAPFASHISSPVLLLSTSQPAATARTSVRPVDNSFAAVAPVEEVEPELSEADVRTGLVEVLLQQAGVTIRAVDAGKPAAWVARGLTEAQVRNALAKAKAIRAKDGSTASIPINLVDAILRDARAPNKRTSSTEKTRPAGNQGWSNDPAHVRECARALGMSEKLIAVGDQKRMENQQEFAARVRDAWAAAEKARG